mmetsp:Transcript_16622/g.21643  ORF Transcript_16622/g.21643 Transcript_16622/m.21643 type:complete len:302 (-) Transcript_16622:987-1892(-)
MKERRRNSSSVESREKKGSKVSKSSNQRLWWCQLLSLTTTTTAATQKAQVLDEVLVPIIQNVIICFVTMAFVYTVFTKGTPDRFSLTHTLWWYPFVFLLLYYGWSSTWQLAWSTNDRWNTVCQDSMIFIRLYIAAQILAIPIELADGKFIDKLPMVAHHIISISGYAYGLFNKRAHFFCAAAGLSEMSTVFLEGVLLANRKDHFGSLFPSWFLPFNGAMLWLTYIIFRLFLFPTLLAIYAYDMLYANPNHLPLHDKFLLRFAIPVPFILLFLLSLMWFSKIHRGFVSKVLKRGGASSKKLD